MEIFSTKDKYFTKKLDVIIKRGETEPYDVEEKVKIIIRNVKQNGDKSLLKYTEKFDGAKLTVKGMKVDRNKIKKALKNISEYDLKILKLAAKRIDAFHRKETPKSWQYTEKDRTVLGQKVTPLERVGIYVPGGKAAYPSTVLMNAIPAKIAGVKEII